MSQYLPGSVWHCHRDTASHLVPSPYRRLYATSFSRRVRHSMYVCMFDVDGDTDDDVDNDVDVDALTMSMMIDVDVEVD